jgi:methionyl-tRNA formyltransferase
MNIVFFGTPQFAIPTLQALVNSHHNVVAVVTQPEKQAGRGKKTKPSEVEIFATKHNIPVFKFKKIRVTGIETLKSLQADIFVTCAYGQILSAEILNMKRYGVINVHGSLLPKYRGSSPMQWSIINGEKTTGITILKSDVGIDDGFIILKREIPVPEGTTSKELFDSLSHLGAQSLLEALTLIETGHATYTEQDHSQATVCKMLTKEMATLNFNQQNAKEIVQLINGLNVWPVCEITLNQNALKLYKALLVTEEKLKNVNLQPLSHYKNGEVVVSSPKQGLIIKAQDGFIEIVELQAPNAKIMPAKSYLNGKKIELGSVVNE